MRDSVALETSTIDRALDKAIVVDWEKIGWLAVLVLCLVTRLWFVGDRAMSHDESLHTYYSWQLADRGDYRHDPMMHGPFLFHATALSYWLFGVNDFTARLLGVFAGLLLVVSPWFLRRWLGRTGALATAWMLLMSPTVMYYSRYIRHDIPVELATALLVVAFIRYVDSRQVRWVILAGFAVAMGITSAEMAYINMFVLVGFVASALVAERIGPRLADGMTVALGAVGLGLLVFSSVAMTGRLGDVASEGEPLRAAMQFGFVASGVCLVFAFATSLLTRFGTSDRPTEPVGATVVADLAAHRYFARYPSVAKSALPLASGIALLGLGLALQSAVARTGADGLAPALSTLLAQGALACMLLGWVVTIYGLAVAVVGQLVARWGERANRVVALLGLAIAALGLLLARLAVLPAVTATGDAAATATYGWLLRPAIGVVAVGLLVLLYGIASWLLEDHESRALAHRLGEMPAGALGIAIAIAVVGYVLLFTTFFTQPDKISGLVDSVGYWLKQHDVIRGDQPWYYYALLAPMYEFLPLVLAAAGVVVYARSPRLRVARGGDGEKREDPAPAARLFVPLLVAWVMGTFWIYSWAGEKMPWLLVHMAVPLCFLAGRVFADLADAVDWETMRSRGWQLAGLLLLAIIVGVTWTTHRPASAEPAVGGALATGWILGLPVIALLLWGLWRIGSHLPRRQSWLAVGMGCVGLLAILNAKYSLAANFVNDELATEYIVYAHGTPDDKLVYNLLMDMQMRVGRDKPLTLAYDNEVSWPFTWYFRSSDWQEAHYTDKKPSGTLSEDVVLVGSPNYGNYEPFLRDRYTSIEYRRMWWPNEGYKGLTPQAIWDGLRSPAARRNLLNILVARKYTTDPNAETSEPKPLTDWYHHANMRLYIKKDLLPKLWPLLATQPALLESVDITSKAPPQAKLAIDRTFSSAANGTSLSEPKGIALGPGGELAVVDHGNKRIVLYGPDGEPTGVVADGELAVVNDPKAEKSAWGVAVGPAGEIYVADTWNHRVLKYVAGKREWAVGEFGNPTAPDKDLTLYYGPRDVAIGPDGNAYIADTGNKRIVVLAPDGTPVRGFGGDGIELGQFNEPTSLAFDPSTGDLLVADLWNYRIQRFDKTLAAIAEWAVEGWQSQEAAHKAYLAVGPTGIVVASDPAAQRVWIWDATGKVLGTLDLPSDTVGLDQPIGVDVDGEGRVLVASSVSNLVTRYSVSDLAGSAQGAPGASASPGGGSEGGPGNDASGAAGAESGGEGAGQGAGQVAGEGAAAGGAGDEGDQEGQSAGPTAAGAMGGQQDARSAVVPTATVP